MARCVTWSAVVGPTGSKFNIGNEEGVHRRRDSSSRRSPTTRSPPTPTTDNVYEVTVVATAGGTDGKKTGTRAVKVMVSVTNADGSSGW